MIIEEVKVKIPRRSRPWNFAGVPVRIAGVDGDTVYLTKPIAFEKDFPHLQDRAWGWLSSPNGSTDYRARLTKSAPDKLRIHGFANAVLRGDEKAVKFARALSAAIKKTAKEEKDHGTD